MVWLPDGENEMSAVSTQYRRVADRQSGILSRHSALVRAYAEHRAVKTESIYTTAIFAGWQHPAMRSDFTIAHVDKTIGSRLENVVLCTVGV